MERYFCKKLISQNCFDAYVKFNLKLKVTYFRSFIFYEPHSKINLKSIRAPKH